MFKFYYCTNALNNYVAELDPVNNIKSSLQGSASTTLSIPEPTTELTNIQKLNSKNFIENTTDTSGNIIEKSKPDVIVNSDVAKGINENTSEITACITSKIKDLLGVFLVQFGIPSLDQFDTPDISEISIKQSFQDALNTIKDTFNDTLQGIKDMFKFKNQNNLDQIETGNLTLKKFLGCENINVDFTPRERLAASKNPNITTELTTSEVVKSQEELTIQTKSNITQRVTPTQSEQEKVKTLTTVEN
jgi:hypothetical protein